jgi:hypothetical protein
MAAGKKERLTSRPFVWIRRGALAILALALVYWIGANVALNTDVLRPVIAKRPEKLLVEWRSGWTILPGVVHVEGLRVRGQTRKMQWQCRFEEGTFRVSLLRLFTKTVRVSRGRGADFEFYFRPRLVPGEELPAMVGAMPEIEGLSNPPDPPPEDLYPPKVKKKAPWLVDVSDVLFEGPVDLWFSDVRMRGNGVVGGGVAFELRKSLEIRKGRLDLADASLTVGGEILADELNVALEASLSPFLPKKTKGAQLLKHFSGTMDLTNGRIPDLAVLNSFLPGDERLLVSGDGRMRASVSAPSPTDARAELDVTLVGVLLDIDGREIRGDISLGSRVEHGDLAEGRFELGETTLSLERMLLPDPKRERQEERQAVREEKAEKKAERRAERRRKQGKPDEVVDPELVEPAGAAENMGWWAHFTLAGGTFVAGKPIVLDTHIDFELRDTRPLLHLFFAKKKKDSDELKTPGWVTMVPNVTELEGDASFDIGPDATIVDDVLITSKKLDVMARVKMTESGKTGQIYVRFGVFHVGVDMREDGKKLRLSKPREWFIAQPEFDDSTTLQVPPTPEP